jgi:hypothetical protein
MEADWEIEVGGDAPILETCWPGFIDLGQAPGRVGELPEVARFPALAEALSSLNAPGSPVWTSKCDVWEPDTFDSDELDAVSSDASHVIACYIDVLPAGVSRWPSPDPAIEWCKQLCRQIRSRQLSCCRADLIVRRAIVAPDRCSEEVNFGITAYLTACGATAAEAAAALDSALAVLTDTLLLSAPPAGAAS